MPSQLGIYGGIPLVKHSHSSDGQGGKLLKEALDISVYESLVHLLPTDAWGVSNDTEKITNSLTPVLLKEIRINSNPLYPYFIFHPGNTSSIRVKFDLNSSNVNYLAFAQVYLNESPKGALRANAGGYYTFSEDINFGILKNNDLIQLYGYTENAAANCLVRNFRLYFNYYVSYFSNIFPYKPYSGYGGGSQIFIFTNTLT